MIFVIFKLVDISDLCNTEDLSLSRCPSEVVTVTRLAGALETDPEDGFSGL